VSATASPGAAPSMKIGPVTGLTLSNESVARSSTVELGVNCPPELSTVLISTVSLGLMERTGSMELSHPK
jgi:hypothetical protein